MHKPPPDKTPLAKLELALVAKPKPTRPLAEVLAPRPDYGKSIPLRFDRALEGPQAVARESIRRL